MPASIEKLESRQLLSGSGATPADPHLVFIQQPTDCIASENFTSIIRVAIEDEQGNILASDQSEVTLSIASGPQGATLGGNTTLASFPPPNNTGIVEFGNLWLNASGVYTLRASDGAYGEGISSSFTAAPRSATLAVSSSNLFPNVGQTVALTAMVAPTLAGVPNPTGSVTFTDGTTVLGTGTLSADPASMTYSSTATIETSWSTAHTSGPISVSYSGDPVYAGVGGNSSFVETIAPAAPVSAVLLGKLPGTTVITGRKTPLHQVIAVTRNNNGAPFHGMLTGTVFLTSGSTLDLNAINLPNIISKPITRHLQRHAAMGFTIPSIPASVPGGVYHLLVRVTDPSGAVSTVAASNATITVAPADVSFSGSISNYPSSVKFGRKISVTLTLTNSGNIPTIGPLAIDFYCNGLSQIDRRALKLKSMTVPIRLRPGKSIKLRVPGLMLPLPPYISWWYPGPWYVLAAFDPNQRFHETAPSAGGGAATAGTITVIP